MAGAAQVVELAFEMPYLAHASMEPLCSVGEWKDGRCEIWAGIQNQTTDQAAAARILGLDVKQVVLNTLYAGGSFGRRATFSADWISELAQLLKATNGAYPIKLMWTREDDITGGFYRPMNVHRLRAGLAADGRMLAIEQTIVAQSFLFGRPRPGVARKPDPTVFEGHVAARYDVPDATLRWVDPDVGVPVQMYRALSHNHTTYSKEVLVDELARRTRRDALEYRLAHLSGHPRQAAVLRLAADKAGWSRPWPAGTALGLAVQEANSGTFIAQVARVRIVDGSIRVERVVCAVDCGVTLNPDIVRSQVEGGIGFGLGAALHGRISLRDGRVQQSNFHDFRQLRLDEMPAAIEVHFIDGGTAPTGIGEPGSVLVAAAVANAVAHLTGKAICRLPFGRFDA
jgi:isoquinoline 1-oxidoreductase beta subunit